MVESSYILLLINMTLNLKKYQIPSGIHVIFELHNTAITKNN